MKVPQQMLFTRSTTNNFNQNNAIPLSSQHKKIISNLETLLKEQTQKRENAQQRLLDYRERNYVMQNQFIRLLEKYDDNVAKINGRDPYGQTMWLKLVDQIQNFNHRQEEMLVKQCSQIHHLMDRKVHEIFTKTDAELQKHKKLSEEEYKTIKQEIKVVLIIAKNIDEQNFGLRKSNKELLFKNKILKEQRDLLIQQIQQKKLLISKLAKDIQQQENQNCNMKSLIVRPQTTLIGRPQTTLKNSRRTISTHQNINHNNSINRFLGDIGQSSFISPTTLSIENSIFLSTRINKKASEKTSIISHELGNKSKSQTKKTTTREEYSNLQTTEHLKLCLEREKKKKIQYGNLMVKVENKNKQILDLIQNQIEEIQNIEEPALVVSKLHKFISTVKLKMRNTTAQRQTGGLSPDELTSLTMA